MRKVSLAQQVFFNLVKSGNEKDAIAYVKNDSELQHAKTEKGLTVLELAINSKCQLMIDWLLENNYPVNIFEQTALGNKEEMSKYIDDNPDALFQIHENGCSLIHIAAKYGHTDLALFLIEKGADIFTKNKNNLSALDIALQKSDISMIEILLKVGS